MIWRGQQLFCGCAATAKASKVLFGSIVRSEILNFMGTLPQVHSVHFYDSHNSLIDRLCGIVSSGLVIGNSVLIVCTEEHRKQLVGELERLEIDVRDYARRGRFSMCDASEMLAMFMVDGLPEADRFLSSVGRLLLDAKKAARSKDQGLTVFGEMVAVLWEKGNKSGALALEELWNRTMEENAFHLHCAYPNWLFGGNSTEMQHICQVHSHVLETGAPAA